MGPTCLVTTIRRGMLFSHNFCWQHTTDIMGNLWSRFPKESLVISKPCSQQCVMPPSSLQEPPWQWELPPSCTPCCTLSPVSAACPPLAGAPRPPHPQPFLLHTWLLDAQQPVWRQAAGYYNLQLDVLRKIKNPTNQQQQNNRQKFWLEREDTTRRTQMGCSCGQHDAPHNVPVSLWTANNGDKYMWCFIVFQVEILDSSV